jgi:hypothetical protein
MPSFSLDSVVAARGFTLDAWIAVARWQHHRVRDHFGPESDLFVILSEDVGQYPTGTPVHWVIADLVARILALENSDRTRVTFTLDAVISGQAITIDAVIKSTVAASLTVDATITRGGSFTIDAVVVPTFTIDAYIV